MVAGERPSPEEVARKAERKLAAILHADVVGFSRLMNEDEVGTHEQLMAHRKVFYELISERNGRIVGTAGDAILADFSSVVDALSAAVNVQEALSERNATIPLERKLEFRIGINLGDVIVDGEDIFGDGVNVAARLEALADPGGIAVSGAVYDQVKTKMNLDFDPRGRHRVKNIKEPVRVYAIVSKGSVISHKQIEKNRQVIVYAAAAILCMLAVVAVFLPWKSLFSPDERSNAPITSNEPVATLALNGKPTIAVLPFRNRGNEEAQAYFSDGITEDVITDLGRFSNLLVLSWNAVAPYKGTRVSLDQLSRDLNVRYVVGGTVHRAGIRLRITVQLTDAGRGVLLYSERFDEEMQDIFVVQERIAKQVVGILAIRLTQLEQERAFKRPTDELDAYEHVLRGRNLLRRVERGANLEARYMFEAAMKIDPRYVEAYIGLGWSHMNDFWYGWSEWPDRAIERAKEMAERGIGLDTESASAHALLASVLTFKQEFSEAEREVDIAIKLNPNNALSHAIRGTLMMWSGKPKAAIPSLELALRLDPAPTAWWLLSLGQSYYFLGRYSESIRLLERFGHRFEEDPAPYALLAAAHGQLGQHDQAAEAWSKLRRVSPFFDANIYVGNLANPEHGNHILEGLSRAQLSTR